MSFTLGVNGSTLTAEMYNELVAYFNGSSSYGSNPISLITMNDTTNYVQSWKNNDTTNGRVAIWYKADGTVLARITKDGFRFSPDGSTADLVPASLSGTETFSGAKTFSAAAVFNSKVTWKRGTSTASTGSLTLPTDGNFIPISGTTTITSITATSLAGLIVCLEFASAGCKVTMGSTLRLKGSFCSSAAGDTLTLECDGTNWNEVGRGRSSTQGVLCAASGQTLTDGAAYAVVALSAATYDPFAIKSGNTFVAPWAGVWRAEGSLAIDNDNSGNRNVSIYKNGSAVALVGHGAQPASANDFGCSWSLPMSLATSDVIDVRAKTASGTNRTIRTASFSALHYVGAV